jgi:hypothetical protein
MSEFTPYYGVLTSITDNTTTYSMKDTDGTEFMFEVYPINISEDEIRQSFENVKKDNYWYILSLTSIEPPSSYLIKKAIDDGTIIKLSIKCEIFDNYGLIHTLIFDREEEKYKIVNSNNISNNRNIFIPFNDNTISLIKSSPTPRLTLLGISHNLRFTFGNILERLYKSEETIKILEEKIKLLESK